MITKAIMHPETTMKKPQCRADTPWLFSIPFSTAFCTEDFLLLMRLLICASGWGATFTPKGEVNIDFFLSVSELALFFSEFEVALGALFPPQDWTETSGVGVEVWSKAKTTLYRYLGPYKLTTSPCFALHLFMSSLKQVSKLSVILLGHLIALNATRPFGKSGDGTSTVASRSSLLTRASMTPVKGFRPSLHPYESVGIISVLGAVLL
mmetsp:Transcript_19796/g.36852  ORF Transcript_19796/g.36852 Transcript_19796/m.36852 type:complete len:208 (-) Transcript_19796:175-798(-)